MLGVMIDFLLWEMLIECFFLDNRGSPSALLIQSRYIVISQPSKGQDYICALVSHSDMFMNRLRLC